MSQIGISTACFYPEDVEASLKQVAGLGAPVTEVFMNSFSEMSPQKLKDLKAIADEGNVKIVSFHPFFSASDHLFLFSGYGYRLDDGIEIYKRFFEAAAFLGAKCLVFHGERIKPGDPCRGTKSALSDDALFEVYRRLTDTARSFGVAFAQESVTLYRSENVCLINFLKEHFPDIRFAFDVKQLLRAQKNPFEMLDAMGDRIVQVHLNNFVDGVCVLPFSTNGGADLCSIHRRLCELGYDGDFCIEVYRSNFNLPNELAQAMKTSKTAFFDNMLNH